MTETIIWKDRPSHLMYFKTYVLCALFFWLIIPIFVAIWKAWTIETTLYTLTDQRLKVKWGVFNLHHDECELYRIRDYSLTQPFFLRLFGLSIITLHTNDQNQPVIMLYGTANGEQLLDKIRSLVEYRRNGGLMPTLDFLV